MSDFKYYITDKDFQSYFVQNGVVQVQGMPRELDATPDGWQDIAINYERNMTYRGMFRSFSVPLGFIRDGAQILRHIIHTKGTEAKTYLIILKKTLTYTAGTPDRYKFFYKSYYRGEIDLSTFVQEEHKVTVNVLDGGLEADIKANETTQYEFNLSELPTRKIKMDGIELRNEIQYLITDGVSTLSDNYPYNQSHLVDIQEISREVSGIPGVKAVERQKIANNNPALKDSQGWFFRATTEGTVHIEYDFILSRSNIAIPTNVGVSVYCLIRKIDKNGIPSNTILFQADQPWTIFGLSNVSGSVDIPVSQDDELYFYTFANPAGSTGDVNINFRYSGEGLFKVTYTYRHPESYVDAVTAYDLFDALIKRISNGRSVADSTYLSGRTDLVISSGDAVRGLDGAKIKTSFADFWQWLKSIEPVAFSVKNNRGYIGLASDIFAKTIPGTRGIVSFRLFIQFNQFTYIEDVRNLKVSLAKEFLFNRLKVGYANQNYEDANGRSEFNSGQVWGNSIKRVQSEIDMVSQYRADAIGIEYVRINLDGKKTTDSSSDNDVFVFHVEKAKQTDAAVEYYALDRSLNMNLTGVISPESVFNVALRPRQMIINNGSILHSGMDKMDDQQLTFISADKNADSAINGIPDRQDINISELNSRLFLPYIFEFETYKPISLVEIMQQNIYRSHCIAFDWEGEHYYGYILKAGIQPVTNEVQTFTLLAAPMNDMTKLI